MKRLFNYLKPHIGLVIPALIFIVLGDILTVLIPVFTCSIANLINDGMQTTINMSEVMMLSIIIIVMIVAAFLFNSFQSVLLSKAVVRGFFDLRKDLNDKLDRIALNYFDTHPSGDIVAKATVDVATMSETFADQLAGLLSNVVLLLLTFIVMMVINWILGLCVLGVSVVGLLISNFIMVKAQPLFVRKANNIGRMNAQIDECFNGHLVIKAFNSEDEICAKFNALAESIRKETKKASFLSAILTPIQLFFSNLGFVVVCIMGAFLMLQPTPMIEIGVIVAFIMFVSQFSSAMSSVLESVSLLQPARAAATRVFELLDEDEMSKEEQTHTEAGPGAVTFSHVRFGYNPERIILKDFSASTNPGYKVAIVGPTGAGKSTLVNLLMRFYELNGGSICIDGQDISTISRDDLHDRIGMVLQETWTFEGTLRDNIVYSTKNVSEERLNEVIDEVGLRPLVNSLPQGLDSVISEQTSISSGQKQLITIARVMIENAPIIILDEATSSIDTRTEQLIQKAIDTLTHGRTSFVIAHRLSTIKNANLIFVMKDGDVVDIGNHDELMARGGLYADLYNSQFD